jgi:hypothetical protein
MRGAVLAALILVSAATDGGAIDRLSRVEELRGVLSATGETAPAELDAALAMLFSLADDEIIENLAAGEPFASTAFIQERLDAFMAAWGGAGFRVHRLGAAGGTGALTVGVFTLPGPAPRGFVRVYGRRRDGEVTRLAAITHDGTPELHHWAAARDGAPQLLMTWLGAASGSDGRALEIELWRRGGRDGVERRWGSSALFPDGVQALGFAVKGDRVTIRYEAPYAGRKPGCQGQTELVDLYRPDVRRENLVLVRRGIVNGWHRELQAAVGRVLLALETGDSATLGALVPDRALALRLPRTLTREPACDEAAPGTPTSATVAVTEERSGRRVPWSLVWRRARTGWRLTAAMPMLQ